MIKAKTNHILALLETEGTCQAIDLPKSPGVGLRVTFAGKQIFIMQKREFAEGGEPCAIIVSVSPLILKALANLNQIS